MSKTQADSIVVVLHRKDFGWSGELLVNGDSASACTAGTAEAVLDGMWAGAFYNDVGAEATYTTGRRGDSDE